MPRTPVVLEVGDIVKDYQYGLCIVTTVYHVGKIRIMPIPTIGRTRGRQVRTTNCRRVYPTFGGVYVPKRRHR